MILSRLPRLSLPLCWKCTSVLQISKVFYVPFTTTTPIPNHESEMKEFAHDKQHLSIPHLVHTFGRIKDKKDRLHDIKKRLEKLKEGGNPNPHHQLLFDYATWGRTDMAEELFNLMKEEGRESLFTLTAYNNMLLAYCSAGQMDKATFLVDQMRSRGMPSDQTTFSTLITGYAKSNQETKAISTLDSMIQNNLLPSEDVVSALLEVLTRKKRMDLALHVVDTLVKGHNVRLSSDVYISLIEGYAQNNGITEALHIFEDIKARGIKPSLRSYCTIIEQVGRYGDIDIAFNLFEQMKREGIAPDVDTYNLLIDLCDRTNKVEKAFVFLDEMKRAGLTPSGGTLGSLEAVCMRNKRMDMFKAHCGGEFHFIASG